MEMSLADEILAIALEIRPHQATLVPENRQEITTEGGLDVVTHRQRFETVTRTLQEAGIAVSAFIDPEPRQIAAAAQAGCEAIELHTGQYANATTPDQVRATLADLRSAVTLGRDAGLIVHGGHGLTYVNVEPVASMPGFGEFNIGHSIVSRAIFVGMTEAVREMKRLIDRAAGQVAGQ
jgi:pyridoxine 5-phosphate synthase